MRKFLTAILTALVVAAVGLPMSAHAARVNTLIKGSHSTIYWAADNGKKYTFPNIATFYTWFSSSDFRSIKKISDKEVKSIPTGGNVTYRGGAKLVKFPGETSVYAVSRYGVLRPILTGDIAAQIYGGNWTSWVETLPWSVRGDYSVGSTIRAASDYSASQEYNGVRTPSDNVDYTWRHPVMSPDYVSFNPTLPTPAFNGTVALSLTNRLYTPDRAQFTATVSGSNRNANEITIQIKNQTRNEIIQTCYASYTCSTTWYVDTVATQEIVAIAKDAAGYSLGSNRVSVQGLGNSSYSNYGYTYPYNTNYPYYGYTTPYYGTVGTVTLSLSNTSVYTNEQVTAYTEIKNYNVSAERLTTDIYVDATRIGSCQGTTTCSLAFNNPNVGTRLVYARVSDNGSNVSESPRQNVYVSEKTASWTQGTFWADRRLDAEWTSDRTLRLTGRITNSNRETQNLRMAIMDQTTGQSVKNCNATDYCTIDIRTDSNWADTSRYALRVFDMNGQELGYVYARSLGSNPYASSGTYNGYDSNWYAPYGTLSVNTNVSRTNTWSSTFSIVGSVSGSWNLSNTRLEIYAIDSAWSGAQTRLVNTCYGVSTCSTQDSPVMTYGTVSYYTVFVDGNGSRTNSVTRSY